MFYLAQVFGIVALFILILSFQQNNTEKLFKLQIASCLTYSLEYLLLGGFSGALICFICAIRNLVFSKHKEQIPVFWLYTFLIIMFVSSIISYTGLVSLLPLLSALVYTIALWHKKLRIIRLAELLVAFIYIIYNIYILAYTSVLSSIIELVTTIFAIYRFDIKLKMPKN